MGDADQLLDVMAELVADDVGLGGVCLSGAMQKIDQIHREIGRAVERTRVLSLPAAGLHLAREDHHSRRTPLQPITRPPAQPSDTMLDNQPALRQGGISSKRMITTAVRLK